ncbi:hypothetical protein PENSPDRAFT_659027 [Peniophora sp. CONT]|nr:hypothetical protein PENSPDRAFT_659027 [Peniophora sp. CONT]
MASDHPRGRKRPREGELQELQDKNADTTDNRPAQFARVGERIEPNNDDADEGPQAWSAETRRFNPECHSNKRAQNIKDKYEAQRSERRRRRFIGNEANPSLSRATQGLPPRARWSAQVQDNQGNTQPSPISSEDTIPAPAVREVPAEHTMSTPLPAHHDSQSSNDHANPPQISHSTSSNGGAVPPEGRTYTTSNMQQGIENDNLSPNPVPGSPASLPAMSGDYAMNDVEDDPRVARTNGRLSPMETSHAPRAPSRSPAHDIPPPTPMVVDPADVHPGNQGTEEGVKKRRRKKRDGASKQGTQATDDRHARDRPAADHGGRGTQDNAPAPVASGSPDHVECAPTPSSTGQAPIPPSSSFGMASGSPDVTFSPGGPIPGATQFTSGYFYPTNGQATTPMNTVPPSGASSGLNGGSSQTRYARGDTVDSKGFASGNLTGPGQPGAGFTAPKPPIPPSSSTSSGDPARGERARSDTGGSSAYVFDDPMSRPSRQVPQAAAPTPPSSSTSSGSTRRPAGAGRVNGDTVGGNASGSTPGGGKAPIPPSSGPSSRSSGGPARGEHARSDTGGSSAYVFDDPMSRPSRQVPQAAAPTPPSSSTSSGSTRRPAGAGRVNGDTVGGNASGSTPGGGKAPIPPSSGPSSRSSGGPARGEHARSDTGGSSAYVFDDPMSGPSRQVPQAAAPTPPSSSTSSGSTRRPAPAGRTRNNTGEGNAFGDNAGGGNAFDGNAFDDHAFASSPSSPPPQASRAPGTGQSQRPSGAQQPASKNKGKARAEPAQDASTQDSAGRNHQSSQNAMPGPSTPYRYGFSSEVNDQPMADASSESSIRAQVAQILAHNNAAVFNRLDTQQAAHQATMRGDIESAVKTALTDFLKSQVGVGAGQVFGGGGRKKGAGKRRPKDSDIAPEVSNHPQYNDFLKAIRDHTKALLHVFKTKEISPDLPTCKALSMKESDDFQKRDPDRAVIKIKTNPTDIGYRFDGFRYDFYLTQSHPFSQHAYHTFTEHFVKHLEDGWYANPAPFDKLFHNPKHVWTAFFNHIRGLKVAFSKRYISMESAEDLMARLAKNARARRKLVLFVKRWLALERYFPHLLPLLSRAHNSICSSDESDHEGAVDAHGNALDRCFRVERHWRAPECAEWLHSIDFLVHSMREPATGTRAISGTNPRTRVKSNLVNHECMAPPGLPINAYTQKYLDSLLDFEKDELDAQPWFDFTALEVPELRERYNTRRGVKSTAKPASKRASKRAFKARDGSDIDMDDGDDADTEFESGDEREEVAYEDEVVGEDEVVEEDEVAGEDEIADD